MISCFTVHNGDCLVDSSTKSEINFMVHQLVWLLDKSVLPASPFYQSVPIENMLYINSGKTHTKNFPKKNIQNGCSPKVVFH